MLEIKSRVLQFKFNDKVQELNYPTVKQLMAYTKKFKSTEDKVSLICEFLVSLGLSQETCDALEMPNLEMIISELTSSKK